jgi:hypothetical protein
MWIEMPVAIVASLRCEYNPQTSNLLLQLDTEPAHLTSQGILPLPHKDLAQEALLVEKTPALVGRRARLENLSIRLADRINLLRQVALDQRSQQRGPHP